MREMCDDKKWVQQTSCGATCIECEKCKQRFFLRKKLSRHQETLLVLNLMFLTIVESPCNAISSKSDQDIIPVSGEKSKCIREDILRNTRRQCMCWIVVWVILMYPCNVISLKRDSILYLQGMWSSSESEWTSYETPILDIVWSKWKSLAWNVAEICAVNTVGENMHRMPKT